jgi:hypothetical protein
VISDADRDGRHEKLTERFTPKKKQSGAKGIRHGRPVVRVSLSLTQRWSSDGSPCRCQAEAATNNSTNHRARGRAGGTERPRRDPGAAAADDRDGARGPGAATPGPRLPPDRSDSRVSAHCASAAVRPRTHAHHDFTSQKNITYYRVPQSSTAPGPGPGGA